MQELSHLKEYLSFSIGGGAPIIPLRYVVNLFKGATPLAVIMMMHCYQNFSLGAYLYYVLHGSYGIIWLVKDLTFGDKNFERKMTLPSSLVPSLLLLSYWSIGWIQISGRGINEPTMPRVATCAILYIFGVCLMMVSDAQKYYTLKNKKGLIDDGMFYATRNPNYLGEMMLYGKIVMHFKGSFAGLTGHTYCYLLLATVWLVLFNCNMWEKEQSLRKKVGWAKYSQQSWILLPKLYGSDYISYAFYIVLFALMYCAYWNGEQQ